MCVSDDRSKWRDHITIFVGANVRAHGMAPASTERLTQKNTWRIKKRSGKHIRPIVIVGVSLGVCCRHISNSSINECPHRIAVKNCAHFRSICDCLFIKPLLTMYLRLIICLYSLAAAVTASVSTAHRTAYVIYAHTFALFSRMPFLFDCSNNVFNMFFLQIQILCSRA